MPLKKARPYLQLKLKFSKQRYEDLMTSCELQITDHVFDTLLEKSYELAGKSWEYESDSFTFNERANSTSMQDKLDLHMNKLSELLGRVSPLYTQAVAVIEMAPSCRVRSTEAINNTMTVYILGQLSVITVMETICVDLCHFWRHAWRMSSEVAPDHPFTAVQPESFSKNVQLLEMTIEKLQEGYDTLNSNFGEIMINTFQRAPSTTALFVPRELRKLSMTEYSIKTQLAEYVDDHYGTGVNLDDDNNDDNDNNDNDDSNNNDDNDNNDDDNSNSKNTILCCVTGKRWRQEVMAVASLVPQSPIVPDLGKIIFNDPCCYYIWLSMRNSVRVHKAVKQALDMNRITLVPVPARLGSGMPVECKVQVIDKSILDETILDNQTDDYMHWLDVVDLPKLVFPNTNRPGLVHMYIHTVMALIFSSCHPKTFKGYKDAMNLFLKGKIWPQEMKQRWLYRPMLDLLTERLRAEWPEFPRVVREGARTSHWEATFEGSLVYWADQIMYDMSERYRQTLYRIQDEAEGRGDSLDYACNEGYT